MLVSRNLQFIEMCVSIICRPILCSGSKPFSAVSSMICLPACKMVSVTVMSSIGIPALLAAGIETGSSHSTAAVGNGNGGMKAVKIFGADIRNNGFFNSPVGGGES